MKILNLGCGTKVSAHPDIINIDWSIYLRIKRNPIWRAGATWLLQGERRARFLALPDNILVHDLSRGLPFPSDSIDVVYHSHLLEHLDRDIAPRFLSEVKRVLKPGGVQRIVVPDFEKLARAYVDHVTVCETDIAEVGLHDAYVAALLEQSVRREGVGASRQGKLTRFIENLFIGDARRKGETHQWMYDRLNLAALLGVVGFRDARIQKYDTSVIPNWNDYGLDRDGEHEYKPGSLYIEAYK